MSSLQRRARTAGAIYLVMSLVGAPMLLLLPRFVVAGDATATAQKIAAGEQVYRLLLLGELAGSVLFIVLGWSLYHLFEEVDRKQAMLLVLFVLASATLGLVDVTLLASPLVIQARAGFLSVFTPSQLDALSLALLKIRSVELRADEALWGLWLVPFGILVIKSGFIPKLAGVSLLVASVGYVAMSVAFIAFPGYVGQVDHYGSWLIQFELVGILWLLIVGARRVVPSRAAGTLTEGAPAVG